MKIELKNRRKSKNKINKTDINFPKNKNNKKMQENKGSKKLLMTKKTWIRIMNKICFKISKILKY